MSRLKKPPSKNFSSDIECGNFILVFDEFQFLLDILSVGGMCSAEQTKYLITYASDLFCRACESPRDNNGGAAGAVLAAEVLIRSRFCSWGEKVEAALTEGCDSLPEKGAEYFQQPLQELIYRVVQSPEEFWPWQSKFNSNAVSAFLSKLQNCADRIDAVQAPDPFRREWC